MALTDVDLLRFLRRSGAIVAGALLVCSLALNAFFLISPLVERKELDRVPVSDHPERTPGRWAFGVVRLPFFSFEQTLPKGTAVRPVSSYTVPNGMVPHLIDEMPLYRDQGLSLKEQNMEELWKIFGAPFDWKEYSLLPSLLVFDSGDSQYRFTIDTVNRVMRISDLGFSLIDSADILSDQTVIDLGIDILRKFHTDPTNFGEPLLTRENGTVWARWPMRWNLLPLLDEQGKTVYGAEVHLSEKSGQLIDVRLNLLDPADLTVSDYPAASEEVLLESLQFGGLLSLPSLPVKQAEVVSYTSIDPIFILRQRDANHPLYVVPALRASWISEQTCKNCAPILFSTFVPALSEKQFVWR